MVAEDKVLRTQAMVDFARDGDVTGLAALADYLQESGGNYHSLRRLRVFLAMPAHEREDVRFFVRMQGIDHREVMDSLKAAMFLRRIENWKDEVCEIEWMVDQDYDPNEYDAEDMPETGYGCVVRWYRTGGPAQSGPEGTLATSLWSITFDGSYEPWDAVYRHNQGGADYKRLVETELAEELFGQVMADEK